jgi:hypothetical protein
MSQRRRACNKRHSAVAFIVPPDRTDNDVAILKAHIRTPRAGNSSMELEVTFDSAVL